MEAEPDGVRHRLESGWHRKVWASCAPASARSGRLSGAASGPASKAVGARKGVAIDTSAFRQYALTADGPAAQASAARRLHQFAGERRQTFAPNRVCRELGNPAGCNPAPLCCAGSIPCHTHHADVAQWQSTTSPRSRPRDRTRRPLQFAWIVIVVDTSD